MSRTIESTPSPDLARERILEQAEPGEPIEVSLADALGLILAEPAVGDVDLPPFDRAAITGYAVRAAEASAGAVLRVAGTRRSWRTGEGAIEAGEAIRVAAGDALPPGADAVVRPEDARPEPEPEAGPPRVIEILRGAGPARGVSARGHLLGAGSVIAPAGTRLEAPMVGLLASQGCVHPVCHRRVRLAVMAIGDHLVGPSEAPVMHRERNAANAAIVALALGAGAMPHDLQAVPESRFESAFERATAAPVIVVLGPAPRAVRRVFRSFGVDPVVRGLAMGPGGSARYGVIRDDSGRSAHHVFHLPIALVAASAAFALLVRPLIARLQGWEDPGPRTLAATWSGEHPATRDRLRVVPVALVEDDEGRRLARPIPLQGVDDLPSFARAQGLALLPARSGPWQGGERVDVVRLGT